MGAPHQHTIVSGYAYPDGDHKGTDRIIVTSEAGPFDGTFEPWNTTAVRGCSISFDGPTHVVPDPARARTSDYLISTVVSGTVTIEGAGGPMTVGAGSVVAYPQSAARTLRLDGAWEYSVVAVDAKRLGVTAASLKRLTDRILVPDTPFAAGFAAVSADAQRHMKRTGPADVAEMENALVTLMRAMCRTVPNEPSMASRSDRLLDNMLEWIEVHLDDEKLTPDSIARAHHVSVGHAHRVFRGAGVTIAEHILLQRLARIRRDIEERPQCSFAQIGARWGLDDASRLSRAFRRAYGMSPSEHRRRVAASSSG